MIHRCFAIGVLIAVGIPGTLRAAPGPEAGKGVVLPRWRQPADPPPLLTVEYLDLLVAREKGVLKVLAVEKRRFSKPQVLLPRYRGRFEIRLLSAAGQLRDVVRFDLPLTGGGTPPAGSPDRDDVLGRKLSLGVSARVRVRAPIDAGIARAVLKDTLERREVPVDLSRVRTSTTVLPAASIPILRPVPPATAKKKPRRH